MKKINLFISLLFGLLLVVLLQLLFVDLNTIVVLPHYINADSFYCQSVCMFSPFTCLWGVNARLDKSSAISINTNKISSQLSSFLSLTKVRYFSASISSNKLIINSRPEHVIFENGKSVLMLPSLSPYLFFMIMPAFYKLFVRISIYVFFNYIYVIKYLYLLYWGFLGLYLLIYFFYLMDLCLDVSILIGWDTNFSGEFLYMDNPNNNVDSFTGEGSHGGTPKGGPGNHNNDTHLCTTDESDKRVRRVNPMSLTQMCGPAVPDLPAPTPEHIEHLDREALQKIAKVLSDEKEEYVNNSPWRKYPGGVTFTELGYNFKKKDGSVVSELLLLKKTEPSLSNILGGTNVDKVIKFCG
jgi:hypothetical protein